MGFIRYFTYLLVLQALMQTYYVPSSMLEIRDRNVSDPHSQNPLVKGKRQISKQSIPTPWHSCCGRDGHRLYGSSIAESTAAFRLGICFAERWNVEMPTFSILNRGADSKTYMAEDFVVLRKICCFPWIHRNVWLLPSEK